MIKRTTQLTPNLREETALAKNYTFSLFDFSITLILGFLGVHGLVSLITSVLGTVGVAHVWKYSGQSLGGQAM